MSGKHSKLPPEWRHVTAEQRVLTVLRRAHPKPLTTHAITQLACVAPRRAKTILEVLDGFLVKRVAGGWVPLPPPEGTK